MACVVIVDHDLFAKGLACLLQDQGVGQVIVTSTDPITVAPLHALILIELMLPEQQSGLRLARSLQHNRPDLTTVVWAVQPRPIAIWAAMEYRIAGFLDKALPEQALFYWFTHAMANGTAWPGNLLAHVREWDQIASRLRGLHGNLWALWAGLLRGESNLELTAQLGWPKRTIERRLTELYMVLGVQSRAQAINLAWKWGLVEPTEAAYGWSSVAQDFFPIPARM
jgi:DNA-binding NarL/FixJ family response regulator